MPLVLRSLLACRAGPGLTLDDNAFPGLEDAETKAEGRPRPGGNTGGVSSHPEKPSDAVQRSEMPEVQSAGRPLVRSQERDSSVLAQ